MIDRRILVFRDDDTGEWGEPGDICGVIFFDRANGDIESHVAGDSIYSFAYLIEPGFTERLVARRGDNEGLDPSVVLARVCEGEQAIRSGVSSDKRKWQRYEAELQRDAKEREIQERAGIRTRVKP